MTNNALFQTHTYHVDDNWILTVDNPETIRLHTDPDNYGPYMDYNLAPGHNLQIQVGQWCEMLIDGNFILMEDADRRG